MYFWIWGSHNGDCGEHGHLGCEVQRQPDVSEKNVPSSFRVKEKSRREAKLVLKELYLQGNNAVWSIESQPTFRRNKSPPSSESKKQAGGKLNLFLQSTSFWNITPCSPLRVNRRFGGVYHHHLQGRRISRARNQSESRRQAGLH
jgi:hypothetical protein